MRPGSLHDSLENYVSRKASLVISSVRQDAQHPVAPIFLQNTPLQNAVNIFIIHPYQK